VRTRLQGTAPPRPVADAPVDVVKAPPEPATDRLPIRACRTCALGANGATL
jgi:hypothetical protein